MDQPEADHLEDGTRPQRVADDSAGAGWLAMVAPLVVVVLAFVAFIPALSSEFVLDERAALLSVADEGGLEPNRLRWMFTTFHTGQYMPLVWLSWAIDGLVWRLRPAGYHLTNLLLHAANALVFYYVAKKLLRLAAGGAGERALCLGAMAAGLLFAVHPLRAESVVWVSERKGLLSAFFVLLCVLAYLRAHSGAGGQPRRWLVWSFVIYVFALLSNPTVVSLPAVLLVLDWYPLRRIGGAVGGWGGEAGRRVWFEKLPFALAALGGVVLAVFAGRSAGVVQLSLMRDLSARVAQSAYGLAFHLDRTIRPAGLAPLYEIPQKLELTVWPFVLSAQAVLVAAAVLIGFRRRWPAGLAAGAAYALMLGPVLGIVPFGPQLTADRYSYLACLGWAVLAGGGLVALWRRYAGRPAVSTGLGAVVALAAVAATLGLAALTWRQATYWHDSVRLWSRCVQVDPSSAIARLNLGIARLRNGQLDEARPHLQEAVKLAPDDAKAHFNLGQCLFDTGERSGGLRHLRRAVELAPKSAFSRNVLGNALDVIGRPGEAIEHYTEALRLAPSVPAPRLNLIRVLLKQNQTEAAVEEGRRAVQALPDSPEAHFQLGRALLQHGDGAEAIGAFETALRHDSAHEGTYRELSKALASQGRHEEAIAVLQRGRAKVGRSPRLAFDLASMLATCPDERFRNGREALRIARELAELSEYRHAQILGVLAAAHAAAGELDQAVRRAEQAEQLALEQNNTELARALRADVERYRSRLTTPARMDVE